MIVKVCVLRGSTLVALLGMWGHGAAWAQENTAPPADSKQNPRYQIERQSRIAGLRSTAEMEFGNEPLPMIGELASNRNWKAILPLAKEQESAIMKLDGLVKEARVQSYLADVEYLEGAPEAYIGHLERSGLRRREAIRHAAEMVAGGLLTEAQDGLVIHQVLKRQQWRALHDVKVQDRMRLSERQRERLLEVGKEATERWSRLNHMTIDPVEQKENAALNAVSEQWYFADTKAVLTEPQLEMWGRLLAEETLPKEAPKLPPLANAEDGQNVLWELSPTFRLLASDRALAIGISPYQKRLLRDLEEVARVGVMWIGLREGGAEQVAKARLEFSRRAEQVALHGVLTEGQAEQAVEALKKN